MDRVDLASERFADLALLPVEARVGGYRATFVSWGHIAPQPWRNYLHVHSFFEVCYAYAGTGTFVVGGAEHAVRAGDVLVARPGQLHEIRSGEADRLGIYFWGHTLVPDRGGAERAAPEPEGIDALIDAFAGQGGLPVARGGSHLEHVLAVVGAEAAQPDAASAAVVSGQAVALISRTARAVAGPVLSAPSASILGHDEVIVRTIERYLRDNASREVRLRDVAAQVHLSERHTSRIFRRGTGTSIHVYLRNLRLELAAQRLLERRSSVTEVAQACGYPDVRHFITAFGRHNGLTPTQFRHRGGTSLCAG